MRKIYLLLLCVALIEAFTLPGCGGNGADEPVGTIVSKASVLSGSEEIPPVATDAGATGNLEVNTTTGAVSGRLVFATAPTTTIISTHVHEGARGTSGSIVITLETSGDGVWRVPVGHVFTAAQISAFSAGTLHFNVHTEAHPNGEIRGQIDQ